MKKGGEILTRAKAPVNVVSVVSAVSVAALAVAGVALVLCVVMAVHSVSGMGLVGCAAGSVCDDVMSGRWSRVLGIVPVSGLAVGVYFALIVSLLCVRLAKDEEMVGLAVKLLPVFAGVIVGSAVWFIGLMLVEEDGVCRYCLAAHSLGLLEAVLLMVLVGSGRRCGKNGEVVKRWEKCGWRFDNEVDIRQEGVGRYVAEGEVTEAIRKEMCIEGESEMSSVSEAVMGMESGWRCGKEGEAGLKIGEGAENCGMGESGDEVVVGNDGGKRDFGSGFVSEVGCERMSEEKIIGERNKWDFARGKRRFVGKWGMFGAGVMLAAVLAVVQVATAPSFIYQKGSVEEPLPLVGAAGAPVIGDAGRAEVVIDILFDYQCSHCQKVHSMLPEVVSRLDGRVAFVLCPCPLSAKCNPYVPREDVRFEGSCELAKIGLAVFGVDPEAFAKYDAWMFEAGEDGWWPRGAGEARAFAEGLVGAGRLAQAMESEWIYERLLQTYELFGRTSAGGQGGIPRFICGEQWVVPEAASAEELVGLLASEFGIE